MAKALSTGTFAPVRRIINEKHHPADEAYPMAGTVIPSAVSDDPEESGVRFDVHAKEMTGCNLVIEKGLMEVREKIAEGRNIVEPLAATKIFPHMVVQMVGVGEQTGALDTMLNKIADFYEDEVDVAVEGMTAMIEPLMMVILGGSIGTCMIAMYMPIFSMAGNVKGN